MSFCSTIVYEVSGTMSARSIEEKTPKKRPRTLEPEEELEIDVDAEVPLSKRAARRLKKGRSLQQAPSSQKPLPKEFDADSSDDRDDSSDDNEDEGKKSSIKEVKSRETLKKSKKDKKDKTENPRKKSKTSDTDTPEEPKKGTNGIWIGNLSFRTSEADLTTFFSTLKPLGKSKKSSDYTPITASDVVRISLPQGDKKGQNKGFAYVDFKSPEHQETAIALSERILSGRNVLIKPADNFDGRPSATSIDEKATKILYIGNLPFDINSDELEAYLGGKKAGIRKVRMATFEDSGKCKGFGFIDFTTPEEVHQLLLTKKLHTMNGRKLKLEYGQDRSLRRPGGGSSSGGKRNAMKEGQNERGGGEGEGRGKVDPRSIKPGQALMNAQRSSHAIVPPKGIKQTFE